MTRQTPMQKTLTFGENALKIVGTIKGVYDFGKEVYNTAQAATPFIESAAALML